MIWPGQLHKNLPNGIRNEEESNKESEETALALAGAICGREVGKSIKTFEWGRLVWLVPGTTHPFEDLSPTPQSSTLSLTMDKLNIAHYEPYHSCQINNIEQVRHDEAVAKRKEIKDADGQVEIGASQSVVRMRPRQVEIERRCCAPAEEFNKFGRPLRDGELQGVDCWEEAVVMTRYNKFCGILMEETFDE
ncbi:hypothetical protein EDB83DRAFT_2553349 [Lactarius deliciosus]|nr:hypothetical protein EDB83DRAFT_2553349 [Lactarius deliciosus]